METALASRRAVEQDFFSATITGTDVGHGHALSPSYVLSLMPGSIVSFLFAMSTLEILLRIKIARMIAHFL